MEKNMVEYRPMKRMRAEAARLTRAAGVVVPCALLCILVCGCPKKKEPPPRPELSSPESYMNDTNFTGRLAAERRAHVALVRDRNAIADKMKAMIEAKKAELKTDDLTAVKEALDRDPAWKDLYSQCTNANAKVEAHAKERLGIVRERITRTTASKTPVSK